MRVTRRVAALAADFANQRLDRFEGHQCFAVLRHGGMPLILRPDRLRGQGSRMASSRAQNLFFR